MKLSVIFFPSLLLTILGAALMVWPVVSTFYNISSATSTPAPGELAQGLSAAIFYVWMGIPLVVLGVSGMIVATILWFSRKNKDEN